MKRSHPPFWFLAILLVSPLLLSGCSEDGQAIENAPAAEDDADPSTKKKKDDELVPIEEATLKRGSIEAVLRYSANLEAEKQVQVFSQAARLVTSLLVEEGDRVKKGDLLLRLQSDEQKSNLTRVQSQTDKARREFERQKRLHAQSLISEQAMNDATYELEQLEIAYNDASRELGYTEVRAPISGIVTSRVVNLGDTITVNQHLFDLVDFDSIVARVYVPEKEIQRLEIGQTSRIFSSSLGGEAKQGSVKRIAPIVDAQSGTVKVTVDVPLGGSRGGNTGPPRQGLRPGMYVEVELVTETRADALLVPKRALIYDDNRAFLFRLTDEMTVERLVLTPRLEDQEWIEPQPDSELREGDRIVVAGQAGLKDGTKVRLAGEKTAGEKTAGEKTADADQASS